MIPSCSVDDPIVAIASPRGGAVRGIVRISGVDCLRLVTSCFRELDGTELLIAARRAHWRECQIQLAENCVLRGRLQIWPTPRSYTGQPLAEFHTLGSPPLLQLVLRKLGEAGARTARPGEFTLRAFLAGRLDLTQAEGVLGAIDADSTAQFHTALEQTAGGLAGPFHALRSSLLNVLAELEAGLDFADEDIAFISAEQLTSQLQTASAIAESLVEKISTRSHLCETIRVALVGLPNAGKSSLFNAISRQNGAIVSAQAGTTRDYLVARVAHHQRVIELCDTAGVDEQALVRAAVVQSASTSTSSFVDEPPNELQVRARTFALQQIQRADVVIWCVDCASLQFVRSADLSRLPRNWIRVATKVDLCAADSLGSEWIGTSALAATGIGALLDRILTVVDSNQNSELDIVATTAIRCAESASGIAAALSRAIDIARRKLGDELIAAEIRDALDHLGQILGAVYNDDVLDRVFSRFCIGK